VAFNVFVPAAGMRIEQVPAATAALHESPAASLTLTFPVRAPAPGDTGLTVKLMLTGCPATDGLGVCIEIEVVVLALFTVSSTELETLPAKFPAPP
jgi:hypothetical protein